MTIIDLENRIIDVTDLPKAIEQAEWFANAKHTDGKFAALDAKLNTYWNDVLIKLKQLN